MDSVHRRRKAVNHPYSHRSPEDLVALREEFSAMRPLQKAALVTFTFSSGLMRTSWGERALLKLFKLRHGDQVYAQFAQTLASQPKTLDSYFERIMAHMVHGKDSYDALSAGGWNKGELDSLLGFMSKLHWTPARTLLRTQEDGIELAPSLRGP
jgi:hypothetical protein